MGEKELNIRWISAEWVQEKVRELILDVAVNLPADVIQALEYALAEETKESAREILNQLLENARFAKETKLPLCQDTGLAVFFVQRGEKCFLQDGTLKDILNKAMIEAYDLGYLRKSVCYPISRVNTGNNSPALIHIDEVPGNELRISFMAKGGGSENMSCCRMLTPAQGWQGIKDLVLECVAQAGPNPCPPTIIGLGIGGSFDVAPLLAKKSLFRPLNIPHNDQEIASMENDLLKEINELGIGPMGLGGKTTSLGVRIEMAPCHIASLPVAVNVQCHSARHKEIRL